MAVTDGSLATLAVGQSVVIGRLTFNFESIADPLLHAVLTDYPDDPGPTSMECAVSTPVHSTRLTGSVSLVLPANSIIG